MIMTTMVWLKTGTTICSDAEMIPHKHFEFTPDKFPGCYMEAGMILPDWHEFTPNQLPRMRNGIRTAGMEFHVSLLPANTSGKECVCSYRARPQSET